MYRDEISPAALYMGCSRRHGGLCSLSLSTYTWPCSTLAHRGMTSSRGLTTQGWELLCFRAQQNGMPKHQEDTQGAVRLRKRMYSTNFTSHMVFVGTGWTMSSLYERLARSWFFAFNSYSLLVSPSQISLPMTLILLHFNLMKHFSLCKKKASGGEFRLGWEEGIVLGVRGCGSGKPRSLLPETGMGLLLAPHFSSLPASQR